MTKSIAAAFICCAMVCKGLAGIALGENFGTWMYMQGRQVSTISHSRVPFMILESINSVVYHSINYRTYFRTIGIHGENGRMRQSMLLCGPPLWECGPCARARGWGGTRPSSYGRLRQGNAMYSIYILVLTKKNSPYGKPFFRIYLKTVCVMIWTTLCWLLASVRPGLLPWAVCLGKFVFWSCGHSKLYIRVVLSFLVTSLWFRVCSRAKGECTVLFF